MKKDNKTKKNSAMKKLVPATGMLLVSAIMLTTATYAWFTMSREVEVTGLKMAATVPEDLQISVGNITAGKRLNDQDSFLQTVGTVEPSQDNMWGNTVQLDHYYEFGRLIPASSNNGTNIFFTPDATKEGQSVKNHAQYFQAANGLTALSGDGSSYMATLHVKNANNDPWKAPSGSNYSGAVTYRNTNDDGYYIDVPVWIRTSSDSAVNLKVKAYSKNNTNYVNPTFSGAQSVLYKAVRVAILGADGSSNSGTQGVIDVKDGASGAGWTGSGSIVDYYGSGAAHKIANGAVFASGTANGSDDPEAFTSGTNWGNIYKAATVYNGDDSIATIAGSGKDATYGEATMLWIRVWLEGEDPQCWNQNEGQDWNISLKFEKITT